MARNARLLTVKQVQDAIRGKLAAGRYADGENLYLRVRAGGSASWVFMAAADGVNKRHEISLGTVKGLGMTAGVDDVAKIAAASLATARDLKIQTHMTLQSGERLVSLKKEKKSKIVVAEYTFDDMAKVYESQKGPFLKKRKQEVDRLISALKEAAPEVEDVRMFTKAHARVWRDARKDQVSVDSVERENNVIKSMFTVYFSESDINQDNPFVGLKMPEKAAGESAITKRLPLTFDEIKSVRKQLMESSREPEIPQIWDVLTMTGARLAEIQGLRMEDVHLDNEIPHIRITPTDERGVKTNESVRWVPLYGIGLEAAKNAAKRNAASGLLFGKQAKVSSTSMSAKIMRQFRKSVSDPQKVTYSLRHSLIDEFREHQVPKEISYPFGGHTSDEIQEKVYGSYEKQLVRTDKGVKDILERYSGMIEE